MNDKTEFMKCDKCKRHPGRWPILCEACNNNRNLINKLQSNREPKKESVEIKIDTTHFDDAIKAYHKAFMESDNNPLMQAFLKGLSDMNDDEPYGDARIKYGVPVYSGIKVAQYDEYVKRFRFGSVIGIDGPMITIQYDHEPSITRTGFCNKCIYYFDEIHGKIISYE